MDMISRGRPASYLSGYIGLLKNNIGPNLFVEHDWRTEISTMRLNYVYTALASTEYLKVTRDIVSLIWLFSCDTTEANMDSVSLGGASQLPKCLKIANIDDLPFLNWRFLLTNLSNELLTCLT